LTETDQNWQPEPATTFDWVVALGLFAGTVYLLYLTRGIGIPRDESFYFHAAGDYIGWFEELWKNWQAGEVGQSFTKSNVDKHWSYNSEHPVLMKTLFALSNKLFDDYLGWMQASTAMRLPAMITGGGTVALTYLFGRQTFGRLAGVVAAGAILLQPRFFAHAHFACFDVPIVFFWVATVYAYWRGLDSKGWALACGLIWGLALGTKLNAFFLPIVLTGHWVLTNWKSVRLRKTEGGWGVSLPPVPWALVAMAILGPIVFYAHTPRFWFDTFDRLAQYMGFHLHHVHYFVYYFGRDVQWPPLPISYPWVMTLVTVPATILIGAALGFARAALEWDPVDWAGRWGRALSRGSLPDRGDGGDPRGTGLLLAMNLLFPIALISMPETPIFGGTKHWMPAMPFLAVFTGAGVLLAWERLEDLLAIEGTDWGASTARAGLAALLALAVCAPAAKATAHIHPFGISYYNEFIGSIRGAADRRMFRQFWGYTAKQALPWLNEHAEKNGRVWTHNTTGYAWWYYEDEGHARKDLRQSGLGGSQYALYHHQKAFVFRLRKLWLKYGTRAPAHVVSKEGVPLLSVYVRPKVLEEMKQKEKPTLKVPTDEANR
jgi:4-amino-4-deoxy-L-arabinose transferase-like glycosyltransferase